MDYLSFWSEMMLQHMIFLEYLLEDREYKTKANNLSKKWGNIVLNSKNPNLAGTPKLLDQTEKVLQETLRFKHEILRDKNKKTFLTSPDKLDALLKHMIMEANYFGSLIRGTISPLEELSFLSKESYQHEDMILGTLKNPTDSLTFQMKEISKHLKSESKEPNMDFLSWLKLSNSTLEEAQEFMQSGLLNSILPEAMLQHELDEGQWETKRFEYLEPYLYS